MSYYAADQATLGDRIAAAREALGLTQKELSDRLGVRRKTLAEWEDDRAEPRANRLHMMSGVLGVSLIWLMTGEGAGLPAPDHAPVSRAAPAVMDEIAALRQIAQDLAARLSALEQGASK
ncbi:multiprotein-bridging factor 1 family protein [Paracoccus sp. p4-l81]|uniref:helix-turn-helix domain-containing protein n=1 Tax=unclassified Paracoccus (in: a-proteobacteria) TaxID=2688777 RepID=UPI0035BA99FD